VQQRPVSAARLNPNAPLLEQYDRPPIENDGFGLDATAGRLRVASTPLVSFRLELISLKFREQRNQDRADTGKSLTDDAPFTTEGHLRHLREKEGVKYT
jgi:hypothetical protein